MKPTKKMQRLLKQMAQIGRMERGKLCQMSGRPHYNHQTWENGRNVVRYVPAGEVAFVQDAIDGYARFTQLSQRYADEVIEYTRRERARNYPQPPPKPTRGTKRAKEKRKRK